MNTKQPLAAALAGVIILVFPSVATGQGVPGDGIPDVYYWVDDGAVAPNGFVSRTRGVLLLDTDGTDLSGVLVSSPTDFSAPGVCILCEGGSYPSTTWPFQVFFTVGYINGWTQWLRSFPLSGPGPIGIFHLADDEMGNAVFPPRPEFNGFSAAFENDAAITWYFDVTLVRVSEPGTSGLLALAMMLLLRRIGQ